MPRITKNRLNSTKFSEFYPGQASSPIKEDQILSKNELDRCILEHDTHIQKVADDYKARLSRYCTEELEELNKIIEECLSKGDFNFPVTPETLKNLQVGDCVNLIKEMFIELNVSWVYSCHPISSCSYVESLYFFLWTSWKYFRLFLVSLKVTRVMFKKLLKGGLSNNKTADINDGEKKYDSDTGETVAETGTIKEGNKDATVVPVLESNQKDDEISNRKIIDEENDSVFKKPAGVSRKTRQASRTMNKQEYKTPRRTGYNKGYNIAKVTPGPNIDRPLSVLRRPVPGEMAVSMNGSPLVTSHDNISVPQMTIPLSNGRALTYLANDGLDPDESLCGEIDEETQERLTVFYKLLERKIKKKT
ncbi:borealin isoform X1 [Halyomorpha halys]|uniref:borealin isoform X1 n=1 Tax=Halyomorpha halys TaxID=286706 RepID=UPI0006D4CD23|nr:borealin-like isoform X1 [Halyomorpha halys]